MHLVKQNINGGSSIHKQEEISLPPKSAASTVPVKAGDQDVIESVTGSKNPFNKHYTVPRLFVIRNDGSGYELLSKDQLEYYFRGQKNNKDSLK